MDGRLIYRLGPAHFRLPLSRGDARRTKQHCQSDETGWAATDFHFAVAKGTLVIPASVQMFKTSMMFYAFFRGRAQKLISELEAASTHVLALLSLQYGKRAERTPVLIEDEL